MLTQKRISKQSQNSDKNICRYIARQCIRCFVDKMYEAEVLRFAAQDQALYGRARLFMLGQLELISGYRALVELLTVDESDPDADCVAVFRSFAKWFLKERSNRYILSGNMVNKKQYIRYKNSVMLRYIEAPTKWQTSLKTRKKN